MAGTRNLEIILIFVVANILFSICLTFVEAKSTAKIAYSLAQAVCTSASKFAETTQIQAASKSHPVNDDLCKTFRWSKCELRRREVCPKFRLEQCSTQTMLKKETKKTRVVNGIDARPHEFPHAVRVTLNGKQYCGGTIIKANYIVSAAHCFYSDYSPNAANATYKIIAGEHNIQIKEGTEQIRDIKSVVWHENYNDSAFHDDIAIVLLDEPLQFNNNVFPLTLPYSNYDATGKIGTVVGWGLTNYRKYINPDILQKIDYTIISNSACETALGNVFDVPDKCFCGLSTSGKESACFGDSGGPFTIKTDTEYNIKLNTNTSKYMLIGISAFTARCEIVFPNGFTQVSKYISWIKDHML